MASRSRDFPRAQIPMTARLSTPDRAVRLRRVRDVGLGGMFVVDDGQELPGTGRMDITLDAFPDGPRIRVAGRVVRVEPGRGIAIQFTEMPVESFDRLDRLVATSPDATPSGPPPRV